MGDGEGASARERSRAAFDAARRDFQAGRYRDALHGFEQAVRLLPSADLWFDIGRSHEELGELPQAAEAYERYLRDAVDPPDRQAVRQRIALLQQALASAAGSAGGSAPESGLLKLEVAPAGAQVQLGVQNLGPAPIDRWISLAPGVYRLRVERAGYLPMVADLGVEAGVVTVGRARLTEPVGTPPEPPRRVWTWVVGGLAAAALLTSASLAIASGASDSGPDGSGLEPARDATLAGGLGCAMLAALLYVVEGEHRTLEVSAR